MSKVFVVGHKNPDTDSITSAVSYARLKNILEKTDRYIPARCGNANNQTKFIFDKNNEKLPHLLKDVYTKVEDIMTSAVYSVKEDDSVLKVLHTIQEAEIRVLPVVDKEKRLKGIIGSPQLLKLFIQETVDIRPKYLLNAYHVPAAIKGAILRQGQKNEFKSAILVGSMPLERAKERFDLTGAEETLLVVGARKDIIKYAVERQVPGIILTGKTVIDFDFSEYKGWVFQSGIDTAETVRRVIMASSAHSIMSTNVEALNRWDYLESVKDKILDSEVRAMAVVDDNTLVGIVTRSNILKKYRPKLILMDHNEPGQAVDGIEGADILEIIDHHRLGTVKTIAPVTFYAKPVGSTCTLVYQLYSSNGIEPDRSTAMLMMGGILSDTIILKSPTTTEADKKALAELSKITGVDPIQYGFEIFSSTDDLTSRTPESIICTDFKKYSEYGSQIGVGQVEVVTMEGLKQVQDSLIDQLEKQKSKNGLDWAMLLITDIIKEDSVLLTTNFEAANEHLKYRRLSGNVFSLPGVLSRKKQLLPEVLRVLEEIS